ncbi:MlaD family protein [Candidatus Avelusimicrobium facis]|uniref:MlaD family protein n=1 Tax=Candidatus Avelusimicrobium facis TaxID=3416203 RepID=UPI003D12EB55
MKPETKLGLFTLLGLMVLGFSLYFLGGFSITRTYDVNVQFADVSGLPVKAAVKLSGVEVGKVKAIKIENRQVIVVAAINEGVELYKDAQFSVVMTGIIGTKYIKVVQGSEAAGLLRSGEYVKGIDEKPMDEQIADTMKSVRELVESVNNQGQFGAQLNDAMRDIRQLSANVNQLVQTLRPYVTDSMKNLEQITDKLNSVMDSITNEEGVLGSLIKDQEMKEQVKQSVSELKTTMTEVKSFVGKMSRFRVYWDYDFFYAPKPGTASSDLALEIFPSSGYTYYRIGMANIGNEDDVLKKHDYVERNKLDVRFGLYNRWATVSAGMIRGAGGIAVEVKPFYDHQFLQRFTAGVELTDWGRDRVINGRQFNKPNLSYGVDYRVSKYFSVGAWMRDSLETNYFNVKANVSFNDQDISSFFGLATMAR